MSLAELLHEIEHLSAADRERLREHLRRSECGNGTTTSWPTGYFALFGALRDSDLTRPAQGEFSADTPRRGF